MKAKDAETKTCPFCFNNPNDGFCMRCISHRCMAWGGNKDEGVCSLIPNPTAAEAELALLRNIVDVEFDPTLELGEK